MGLGRPARKIKINSTPQVKERIVTFFGLFIFDGMELGIGWTLWDSKPVRCVRWRDNGLCRYILIGRDRGLVIPVVRNFQKIRPVTKNEKKRIHWWIERRIKLLT